MPADGEARLHSQMKDMPSLESALSNGKPVSEPMRVALSATTLSGRETFASSTLLRAASASLKRMLAIGSTSTPVR